MGNFDEVDHLASGYLMKNGRALYSENFSHHFPFPYYWVYLFTPLWSSVTPARTIAVFRLSLLVLYLICYLPVFLSFRDVRSKTAYSVWILLLSFYFAVYQGYAVISESFNAVFLSGIAWIILPVVLGWEKWTAFNKTLVLVFSSLAFWTQPFMGILFSLPLFMESSIKKAFKLLVRVTVFNLLVPFALFLNGQLGAFIFQALYFNFVIYPRFYFDQLPSGSVTVQLPLLIAKNTFSMLSHFSNPLQIVQAVFTASFVAIAVLVFKKRSASSALMLTVLFAATRLRDVKAVVGKPFDSGIYPFILLASACFVVLVMSLIRTKKWSFKLLGAAAFISILYLNFQTSSVILFQSFKQGYNYHVFWSYRQATGELMRSLSRPGENVLVYPHDVELYFFADRMPPDRFTYWFPWINAVPQFRTERLQALKKTPPALLYVGNLSYQGKRQHYATYFPDLVSNYIQVIRNDKKTGIWLRKDLKSRLPALN